MFFIGNLSVPKCRQNLGTPSLPGLKEKEKKDEKSNLKCSKVMNNPFGNMDLNRSRSAVP